ncbi:hypothetical protein [Amycolatopsis eburnea]|uniref:VCBS repeat-containing protein n=1 Tax=Amycolatopsis eburnea TaxID=2267691 RepID=A0A3R9EK06_9PSEU|nr:hypothetical protein [Amycolatopsis eburnea]RSD08627.1 hypothetical protein EIY87_43530 [Amycolatopsis eburnea]
MRGKIAALITTLGVLAAGCTAGTPRPAELSKEIESFPFGDTEWYDAVVDTTLTLKGGLAHRETDGPEYPGGLDWRMLGPPAYTDIDDDGDEDAAVGLYSAGGQMVSQTWFVWLWTEHTAKQVRHPLAASSRCDGFIESVTAKRGAFSVRASLSEEEDSCASGGGTPITYEVGLRGDWPVRTSPAYGPLETCNTREQTKQVTPARDLQLRVAADDASPPIGSRTRYDAVLVAPLDLTVLPDGKGNFEWLLVTAVQGAEKVCGWARVADIVGL